MDRLANRLKRFQSLLLLVKSHLSLHIWHRILRNLLGLVHSHELRLDKGLLRSLLLEGMNLIVMRELILGLHEITKVLLHLIEFSLKYLKNNQ